MKGILSLPSKRIVEGTYKSIRPNERKGQWFEAFARKVSDTTYNPMVSIPLAMVSIP